MICPHCVLLVLVGAIPCIKWIKNKIKVKKELDKQHKA